MSLHPRGAHAAALDELCETLFHGELAPAARHAVAENAAAAGQRGGPD